MNLNADQEIYFIEVNFDSFIKVNWLPEDNKVFGCVKKVANKTYRIDINLGLSKDSIELVKLHEYGHIYLKHMDMSMKPFIDLINNYLENHYPGKYLSFRGFHEFMNWCEDYQIHLQILTKDQVEFLEAEIHNLTGGSIVNPYRINLNCNQSLKSIVESALLYYDIESMIQPVEDSRIAKIDTIDALDYPYDTAEYDEESDISMSSKEAIDSLLKKLGEGEGEDEEKLEEYKSKYANDKYGDETDPSQEQSESDSEPEDELPDWKSEIYDETQLEDLKSYIGSSDSEFEVVDKPIQNKKLEDILNEIFAVEKVISYQVDSLKLQNRRSRMDGLIHTTVSRKVKKSKEASLGVIIDVSGSMDKEFVTDLILQVKKCKHLFSRKSRVILIDDRIRADFPVREDIPSYVGDGGTNLLPAFEAMENYRFSRILVVSDLMTANYDEMIELMESSAAEYYGYVPTKFQIGRAKIEIPEQFKKTWGWVEPNNEMPK